MQHHTIFNYTNLILLSANDIRDDTFLQICNWHHDSVASLSWKRYTIDNRSDQQDACARKFRFGTLSRTWNEWVWATLRSHVPRIRKKRGAWTYVDCSPYFHTRVSSVCVFDRVRSSPVQSIVFSYSVRRSPSYISPTCAPVVRIFDSARCLFDRSIRSLIPFVGPPAEKRIASLLLIRDTYPGLARCLSKIFERRSFE